MNIIRFRLSQKEEFLQSIVAMNLVVFVLVAFFFQCFYTSSLRRNLAELEKPAYLPLSRSTSSLPSKRSMNLLVMIIHLESLHLFLPKIIQSNQQSYFLNVQFGSNKQSFNLKIDTGTYSPIQNCTFSHKNKFTGSTDTGVYANSSYYTLSPSGSYVPCGNCYTCIQNSCAFEVTYADNSFQIARVGNHPCLRISSWCNSSFVIFFRSPRFGADWSFLRQCHFWCH